MYIHHTPYTIHHTPYTIHNTQYTKHFTLYTIYYTLYTIKYTLYTIHKTLYTIQYRLYTVNYILYTIQHTSSVLSPQEMNLTIPLAQQSHLTFQFSLAPYFTLSLRDTVRLPGSQRGSVPLPEDLTR